jgi:hypothetical protein
MLDRGCRVSQDARYTQKGENHVEPIHDPRLYRCRALRLVRAVPVRPAMHPNSVQHRRAGRAALPLRHLRASRPESGASPRGPTARRGRRARLTAGGQDRIVPPVITRATHRLYRKSAAVTALKEFPERGQSIALDSGWKEVAEYVLAWLKQHAL